MYFSCLQVLIFPSNKTTTGSTTTANVWLHVIGSHGDTSYLCVPRGVTHFSFWSTNIGIVTSLRLGHDNYGSSPNWLIDHIILRNEYTGTKYSSNTLQIDRIMYISCIIF